jgi:1-acyl-sn-glycerol-3-phosphate acyltransferase
METVPAHGPFILVLNHINFLEVPVVYTAVYPRLTSALVKAETWENPFLGRLADLWNGIALKREVTDFSALREAEERLRSGHILMVAPEGTRSYDGRMGPGNPGVVALALRAEVPVLPMVHYGGEAFWDNLKRLKRTPVTLRAGTPFRIELPDGRVNARVRLEIINEIMEKMAALLPEYYRGIYSGKPDQGYVYLKPVDIDDE